MRKITFILLLLLLSFVFPCISQNDLSIQLSNQQLEKQYESSSITKNKLAIGLQIIDNYIEVDKDDSAQIWFDRISSIRDYSKVTEQDYFLQSLQTELYYFSDLLNLADQSSNEAIDIATKLKNHYFLADAYFYKGLIQHAEGNNKEALKNLLLASEANPHSFNIEYKNYIAMPVHIYNNIAQVFNSMKEWDSSYKYNMIALNELKKNHVKRSESLIYHDLANMFRDSEQDDSAIIYYNRAIAICKNENTIDIPLLLDIGLAKTMIKQNNHPQAKTYLEQANRLVSNGVNNYYARVFYEEAIPLYKALGDLNGELLMYKNLHQIHIKNNEAYTKKLMTIYEHTTDNKNKLLISNLQTSRLKQHNSTIQLLFMTLLLVSAGISFFLYRKRILVSQKLKIVRSDIGKDLHDEMGGCISSIKMYSGLIEHERITEKQMKDLNKKISSLASELGQKLSTIIWSMDEKNDSIGNLVEKLQEYSTPFFESSDIHFQFSQSSGIGNQQKISGIKRKNLFLVCKEGLNNIIKHSGATNAWLCITCLPQQISIEIIDNGKGISDSKKLGNGLKNMEARMAEIEGSIKWSFQDGTYITLQCPI